MAVSLAGGTTFSGRRREKLSIEDIRRRLSFTMAVIEKTSPAVRAVAGSLARIFVIGPDGFVPPEDAVGARGLTNEKAAEIYHQYFGQGGPAAAATMWNGVILLPVDIFHIRYDYSGGKRLSGLIFHELIHITLDHLSPVDEKGRDPFLWNLAADVITNAMVVEAGFSLLPGSIYDPALAYKTIKNEETGETEKVLRSVEEVYRILQSRERQEIRKRKQSGGAGRRGRRKAGGRGGAACGGGAAGKKRKKRKGGASGGGQMEEEGEGAGKKRAPRGGGGGASEREAQEGGGGGAGGDSDQRRPVADGKKIAQELDPVGPDEGIGVMGAGGRIKRVSISELRRRSRGNVAFTDVHIYPERDSPGSDVDRLTGRSIAEMKRMLESNRNVVRALAASQRLFVRDKRQGFDPLGAALEFDVIKNETLVPPWIRNIRGLLLSKFGKKEKPSWRRLNRRYPLIIAPGTGQAHRQLFVVFVDTSGSIGRAELSLFFSLIRSIARQVDADVLAVMCDADVQGWVLVKGPQDVDRIAAKCKKGDGPVRGGGGTDFRPPFEKLEQILGSNELRVKLGGSVDPRSQLSALFYLTDGYGTFPSVDELKKHRMYRKILQLDTMFWLLTVPLEELTRDGYKPPFGRPVFIDPEWTKRYYERMGAGGDLGSDSGS